MDGRDAIATSYLRTLDGLCGYQDTPTLFTAVEVEAGLKPAPTSASPADPAYLPSTKDANLFPPFAKGGYGGICEHTAIVVAVPDRITSNFRSALEKTRGVIMAGQLLIHETRCPKLIYTLRQPLDEILKSPVMKALVWVITALEDHKGDDTPPEEKPDPWYGNLRRGPA